MRSLIVLAAGGSFLMAACSDPAVEYDGVAGAPDLAPYAKTSDLHAVARSGSYDDLSGTPDLGIFAKSDDLSGVAQSGQYADQSDLLVRSGYRTLAVAPVRLEASAQYTWELIHPSPFSLVGYSWASYEGGRGSGTSEPGMDFRFATHMRRDLGSSSVGLAVTPTGKVGVGNVTPTAALDVAGDLRVRSSSSPASDDPCHQGQITWDGGYVYVCVQTNEWKRAALSAY